jgi:hypothetical protein
MIGTAIAVIPRTQKLNRNAGFPLDEG